MSDLPGFTPLPQPSDPPVSVQQTVAQFAGFLAVFGQMVNSFNAILTQMKTGVSLIAQVPTYTYGNLPAAATHPALVVFCSNARKPGEGAGAGTGMLVFSDSTNWYSTAGTVAAI